VPTAQDLDRVLAAIRPVDAEAALRDMATFDAAGVVDKTATQT